MLSFGFVSGRYLGFLLTLLLNTWSSQISAEPTQNYRGEVGSFTNDYFGDGHDRWSSGSYQRSYYSQGLRNRWVDGIELRWRTEIITPWTPSKQQGGDVPFSTALGFGGSLHRNIGVLETRLGGEILVLGDFNGLEYVQRAVHDGLGMEESFDPTGNNVERVENGLELRFDLEIATTIPISRNSMIRPYSAITIGGDQATMVGADIVLGPLARAEIWTRDVVTGRLLTPQVNQFQWLNLVAGWDARSVDASIHLPEGSRVDLQPAQFRARLGLQVNNGFLDFFIGQAWLSPSFVNQAEPQRVGMLSVGFAF